MKFDKLKIGVGQKQNIIFTYYQRTILIRQTDHQADIFNK